MLQFRRRVSPIFDRLDILQKTGRLDGLLVSLERFSPKLAVLDAAGRIPTRAMPGQRIGAALVFDRLWRELGIDRVLAGLLRAAGSSSTWSVWSSYRFCTG